MSQFATLDNHRIISGNICIPYYGLWCGDVVLASPASLPKTTILSIANLNMQCAIFRSASFSGSRSARIIGGFGGWRNEVKSQASSNNNGIRISTILGDVAATVGEQVKIKTDSVIGTTYVRDKGPASRVLRQILDEAWWIDTNGVIQTTDRTDSSLITSQFTVDSWTGSKGSFIVATEDIKSWLPGRTFVSPTVTIKQQISQTIIDVDNNGKLRLNVLSVGPHG